MPMTHLSTTQVLDEGLLRQALALPPEQKLQLMQAVLQSELGANAEEQRRFLQTLDATLTEWRKAETPGQAQNGRPPWQERHDKAMIALEWVSHHRKEYGGQWVALDGDRLLAAGTDIQEVYAVAQADGAYLPMIDYVEPADAPPFLF